SQASLDRVASRSAASHPGGSPPIGWPTSTRKDRPPRSSPTSRFAAGASRASSGTSSAFSPRRARPTSADRRSSSTAERRGPSFSAPSADLQATTAEEALVRLTPLRLVGVLAGLLLTAAIALYLVPSDDYLLLPDEAHLVAPIVKVQGGHDPTDTGGIYYVDVFERRASMFESLFPWIHKGSTLVPARLIVPPGVSDKAVQQADLRAMTISQKVAAAVALR